MYIFNDFSGTEIQYNNTVFEPGIVQEKVNNLISLTIQVPSLVPGLGSVVRFTTFTNAESLETKVIDDQGSNQLMKDGSKLHETTRHYDWTPWTSLVLGLANPILLAYYAIFFGLISLYFRRRKKIKSLRKKIARGIMETREVLRNDPTNKDIFSPPWLSMSDKGRQTINSMNDYLLIDDF